MANEWKPESHWDNHPDYCVGDWIDEVYDDNTRQGYVAWVNSQMEIAEDDAAADIQSP